MVLPGSLQTDQVIDLSKASSPAECDGCEERPALLNTVHFQICDDPEGIQYVWVTRVCEECRNQTLGDKFSGVVILAF